MTEAALRPPDPSEALMCVCVFPVSGVLPDPDAAVRSVRAARSSGPSPAGDEESWNYAQHHHIRILQ